MNTKDPVAAYFDTVPKLHKRQFVQGGSGASFYFRTRLKLACELASASPGRLERRCQNWASRHVADALYLLAAK
ncbi:MAG TPA: hypothetical protein VH229_10210 [Candidatus Udaeobacter sp.]|jgi:hypothetical protein|nr:hypothetical protein [Candidatus Udaeobacter sp.]